MRENRPKYRELSEEDRRKSRCRAFTRVQISRGEIVRGPCECCGNEKSQAHHVDYDNPWLVFWLCKECHKKEHDVDVGKCRVSRGNIAQQ